MINISKAVSLRILELLKQKGISQYKLQQITGISRETIKSIMKGKTKGVNLKTILLISEGLKISVSEFLNSPLFSYENLDV